MAERCAWIEPGHRGLGVRRQCELLGLHRANLYYEPIPESAETLHLMRLIDEDSLRHPFLGSRRLVLWLSSQGHVVNRKKMQRLLGQMGIQGITPGSSTTVRAVGHKVYPYLQRGVEITRPNQVRACDITYVPLQCGDLYLTAVMDWFSRCVLSWRLSKTMDVEYCCAALDETLRYGRPEIFNTDQGSQFTSEEFTGGLAAESIAISMDGKGRALDNVMIERLGRTVKYENIDLKDDATGADCHQGL